MSVRLRSFVLFFALFAILTAVAPAALAQEADVLVEKGGPSEAAEDTDVAYTVTVTNLGPDDAVTVALDDVIPAGMTFVSATQDSGPTFVCNTGGSVNCTIALLAAGSSASFTFVFHIDSQTAPGTSFTNIATVTSGFDPNSENDSSTVVTTTPPPPQGNLFVIKSGPNGAAPDSDVAYTITVGNAGPDDAENVELTDTLPGTMEFVSLTQDSGPALTCMTPAGGSTGGQSSCTAASFPRGATATFTLTGHVPAGTPSGTSFANTADVTASNDPDGSNDSSSTSLIVSSVNVGVDKVGPPTATAGGNISYTLTVTNSGADPAVLVSLTDPLPDDTTFVSLTADNGAAGGATCGTPLPGSTGTVTCTFPTLGAGATAQFTLTLLIGNTTSLTNTVTVGTDSFDTDPANDSDSVTTLVTPIADVTVTKTGPAVVVAGENVSYMIDVTNAGPSTASVTLSDTLPAGTTYVLLASPPGWSCTNPAMGASGTVTCNAATLQPGVTASFTIAVNVAASVAPGSTIANTATISSFPNDPNSGNNSSTTIAAVVNASADLGVTKSGPAAVSPDSDITYTVTVSNAGPSDASTVALSDTTPANTTFVSATQTSGPTFACTPPPVGGTGTLTCTIATLNAGASATFSLVLHVDGATPIGSTIANTASASSSTFDPTSPNDSATSNAAVAAGVTDVRIQKTANQPQFATGADVTYTITVTNDGPAIAIDTMVEDALPAGTTFVSATPSQGTCSGTAPVTCSLGNLNAGATATITLVVTFPSTPGPVQNIATVTNANVDSDPSDNSSTSVIAVSAADAVPTLSEWMLLLLALSLAVVGMRMR